MLFEFRNFICIRMVGRFGCGMAQSEGLYVQRKIKTQKKNTYFIAISGTDNTISTYCEDTKYSVSLRLNRGFLLRENKMN